MLNVRLDLTDDEVQHLRQVASTWNVTLDEAAASLLRHGLAHVGPIEPIEPGDTPTGFGMLIQLTDEQAAALEREAERQECTQEDLMSSAIFRYTEGLADQENTSLTGAWGSRNAPPHRLAS